MGDQHGMEDASSLILSKDFFKVLIQDESFKEILHEFDIGNEDIPDLFDTFDADLSGFLSVKELLRGIKKMRGEPKRSDIVEVGLVVHAIHDLLTEHADARASMREELADQHQKIRELVEAFRLQK